MQKETICYIRDVNYYETDRMGIVHHSNYIRYFEEARLFMMEKAGLNYAAIEERGIIIPVLFVNCEYVKPLRYGDTFRVETRLSGYRGLKMEVSYEIYSERTGELCTTGESGHCFLYPDMKPVRMKRDFPDIHDTLNRYLMT
ncbi:MAG: acyl-CoA thioesterase [Lachnospiraceae bacterium]|nr:acyl-CoA thioesterase [Lachnospiraceae bacterium]